MTSGYFQTSIQREQNNGFSTAANSSVSLLLSSIGHDCFSQSLENKFLDDVNIKRTSGDLIIPIFDDKQIATLMLYCV